MKVPPSFKILLLLISIFLLAADAFAATPPKPTMSDAAVLAIYKEYAGREVFTGFRICEGRRQHT